MWVKKQDGSGYVEVRETILVQGCYIRVGNDQAVGRYESQARACQVAGELMEAVSKIQNPNGLWDMPAQ